jgi:hypothetical protein
VKIGYEYMVGYADALRNVEREMGAISSNMTEEEFQSVKSIWLQIRHWAQAADQAATTAKRSKDRDKRNR